MNRTQEMEAGISILDNLRRDEAHNQSSGLPFIMASVIIWIMISVITGIDLDIKLKNMLVFCCSCPLMPLAWLFGKFLNVNVFDKSNPLGRLGVLVTMNQMLYLLIVMWAFRYSPENMVMLYAMVFGAHLLPYSWLYKNGTYMVAAIVIPFVALFTGLILGGHAVALVLTLCEIVFAVSLAVSEYVRFALAK